MHLSRRGPSPATACSAHCVGVSPVAGARAKRSTGMDMGALRGLATMGTAPLQSLQVWFEGVIGRRQR